MKMLLVISLLLTNPGVDIYPMTGEVVSVDYVADVVTIEAHNNLWEFYGAEDWELGDVCACIMSDNGTKEIYDDEIIVVRYQGGNYDDYNY